MTLWQVRTQVRDSPGTLARLAAALGSVEGNVIGIDVHGCDTVHVHDDLFVDVPDAMTGSELAGVLAPAVGRDEPVHVRPARAHELVDGPSHALALAARLIDDPTGLPGLLCQLVGGNSVDLCGQPPDETAHQLVVAAPGGGGFVVIRRDWAPFTLIERARVDRLVACAAAVEPERSAAGRPAVLVDGAEVRIRAGGYGDAGHVAALLERCSGPTRQRRFMATTGSLPAGWLLRLASPPNGFSVLAFAGTGTGTGELIGMAQCLPYDGDSRSPWEEFCCHEIGLLVADGWQRRGVGTQLMLSLVRQAAAARVDELVAISHAGDEGAERVFARAGLAPLVRYADGVREVRARLRTGRRTTPAPVVVGSAAAAGAASAVDAVPAADAVPPVEAIPAVDAAPAVEPVVAADTSAAVLSGQRAFRAWERSRRR